MEAHVQRQFNSVVSELWRGTAERRWKAAQALRDYGLQAVEPLCFALRDEDPNVCAAAAESLGYIGDEQAVQPLVEALSRCFVGQSARWQLIVGIIILLLLCLYVAVEIFWNWILENWVGVSIVALLYALGELGSHLSGYWRKRDLQDIILPAVIKALARIAECNPAPELRNLLPDLKAIAADVVHHNHDIRAVSRQAVQRIEVLTEQLKSLPLPAFAPAPDTATLPRIADASALNIETLPRVADKNKAA